jgi:hypothetical protein
MFVESRDAENLPALPINQAPRRKFMICMGLRRPCRVPISQAPRRNSQFDNEMCLGPHFAERFLPGGLVCAALYFTMRHSPG